ncbi:MAG: response regulator [Acidobacteria bacterium]|nr:response regulator [Acidobacteriota bacterium]
MSYKVSVFTGVLVVWVAATILALDARPDVLQPSKLAALGLILLAALVIARLAIGVLARPLSKLQEGLTAVRMGRLEPIAVSRSHDEIEYLGDSFNQMIAALGASRAELQRHSESLEDGIRQRTEELDRAMRQATAASQAKTEFLANVSHELRTPMNGVIGMIEVTLDSRLNSEQREHLETALRCAYSLLALVNDILDVSKIESGKMVLEKIPFDIRQLVTDCVETHRQAALSKGLAVGWTIDPSAPTRITGDSLRIRQMLSNLLSNAVKFTDQGEVHLAVEARPATDRTFELVVSVRDTGPGIAADKLAGLFEPFTQVDGSVSRRHGGTGLGLAITRRLAQMHGGAVHAESTPGVGSTFTLTLLCEPTAADAPETAAPEQAEAQIPASRRRVLVAEDNLINQKVVTAILRKKGFEPVLAGDGQAALDLLRAAPPDYYGAVLMDVQMPRMDGLEATREIRRDARWTDLPILAMTAHAMIGDRDRCLQAGMTGYVSKPVNPAHLISTLERHIRQGTRLLAAPETESAARASAIVASSESSLAEGMVQVFLQLAPERLSRLSAAARRGDTAKLAEEAQRIASAAQRIAAAGVSECTRAITRAAAAGDYSQVEEQLVRLSAQIAALEHPATAV